MTVLVLLAMDISVTEKTGQECRKYEDEQFHNFTVAKLIIKIVPSVCTIKLDALLNVIRCNTMGLPAACVGADFEKAEKSSHAPAFIESYSFF